MDFEKLISCQTDAIIIEEDRLMDFCDFYFLSRLPSIAVSQHIRPCTTCRTTKTLITMPKVEMLPQNNWKAHIMFFYHQSTNRSRNLFDQTDMPGKVMSTGKFLTTHVFDSHNRDMWRHAHQKKWHHRLACDMMSSTFLSAAPLMFEMCFNVMCGQRHRNAFNPF